VTADSGAGDPKNSSLTAGRYQLLPVPKADERVALKADIVPNGVRVPGSSAADTGQTIDGSPISDRSGFERRPVTPGVDPWHPLSALDDAAGVLALMSPTQPLASLNGRCRSDERARTGAAGSSRHPRPVQLPHLGFCCHPQRRDEGSWRKSCWCSRRRRRRISYASPPRPSSPSPVTERSRERRSGGPGASSALTCWNTSMATGVPVRRPPLPGDPDASP
jgi:hypothetical protein